MKRFGVMVVKPDAMNEYDLDLIYAVLDAHGLTGYRSFACDGYGEIIKKYRQKDIVFKSVLNLEKNLRDGLVKQTPEEEMRYCQVAIDTYNQFFDDKFGIILIPTLDQDPEDFYEKMYQSKKEIRSRLRDRRPNTYAYLDYKSENRQLKEIAKQDIMQIYEKDPENVCEAHIDGVHLEDYECFVNSFCLSFMVNEGQIRIDNRVDLREMVSGNE